MENLRLWFCEYFVVNNYVEGFIKYMAVIELSKPLPKFKH